jgi:NADH-quinone oxidoreductase subunit M
MFTHGIIIIALFFIADIFKTRTDSSDLENFGGINNQAPVFSAFYLIILLASIGFPLTSSFTGEFLMISGLVKINLLTALIAGTSIILGAAYMFTSFKKTMLGESKLQSFADVSSRERIIFFFMVVFVFSVGLFPSVFLQATEKSAGLLAGLFSLI